MISQIKTLQEFQNLQFRLLGNSLETFSLPSALIIVEGKTDLPYIAQVVSFKFPDRAILVVGSQGDVKRQVHSLNTMLGKLSESPYGDRTFVVLDSVHEKTQKSEVEKLGVPAEHVIVWSKNGIEHLYPIDILGEIFQLNPTKLATQLTIEDDLVKATSKSLKKGELSTLVCAKLTPKAILPEELVTKLIEPLGKAIGPK